MMSRDTTKALAGQTSVPGTAAAYDAQRISVLLLAQKVDDKCRIMPGNIRKEFDSRIVAITTDFAKSTGEPALVKIRTVSAEAFQKIPDACDKAELF